MCRSAPPQLSISALVPGIAHARGKQRRRKPARLAPCPCVAGSRPDRYPAARIKIAESDPSHDCRRSAPACSHPTRQRGRGGDANRFGCFFPEINESPPRHFLYRIAADINEMFVALVKMLSPVVGIELAGSLIVEYRTALLEFHIGYRALRYVPVAVPVGTTYNGHTI